MVMASAARDTLAEDAVRGWLRAPWVSFDHQCAMVQALGYEVSSDPELVHNLGPKGMLAPDLVGVVVLQEGALSAMSFGEMDMPSVSGRSRSYIRELWFFDETNEVPWFDLLCEEMGSEPHAKHEPTTPPILSWMWASEAHPDNWVRLTRYPDGGIKITQINRVPSEQAE
jgi:hypothetical protein